MKLREAIETLETLPTTPNLVVYQRGREAIQLGIEALKYYQETRPIEVSRYCPLLPGETKD